MALCEKYLSWQNKAIRKKSQKAPKKSHDPKKLKNSWEINLTEFYQSGKGYKAIPQALDSSEPQLWEQTVNIGEP